MQKRSAIRPDSPYCAAVEGIRATDAFKRRTLAALRAQAAERAAVAEKAAQPAERETECQGGNPNPPLVRRRVRFAVLGAALCLLLCLGGVGLGRLLRQPPPLEADANLPLLTVGELGGTMGYEGYLAPSIEELENGNPWTEGCGISVLPVYENPWAYDDYGSENMGQTLSGEEMLERVSAAAERMGLTVQSIVTHPTQAMLEQIEAKTGEKADATPTSVEGVCEGVTIEVDNTGRLELRYEPGLSLPKKYTFTDDGSRSDNLAAVRYLAGKYLDLGGFGSLKKPVPALFGDYLYTGKRNWHCRVYDGSGDLTQQILSWNFTYLSFHPNEEGLLWLIRDPGYDLSHKIGNYPIISQDEAMEQLLAGRDLTTVPEEVSGGRAIAGETVAKVELVYRNAYYDKVFMPYYRFWVELEPVTIQPSDPLESVSSASDPEQAATEETGSAPSQPKEGEPLRHFGAYYVPAVEERYLTGLPAWDGSFN